MKTLEQLVSPFCNFPWPENDTDPALLTGVVSSPNYSGIAISRLVAPCKIKKHLQRSTTLPLENLRDRLQIGNQFDPSQ